MVRFFRLGTNDSLPERRDPDRMRTSFTDEYGLFYQDDYCIFTGVTQNKFRVFVFFNQALVKNMFSFSAKLQNILEKRADFFFIVFFFTAEFNHFLMRNFGRKNIFSPKICAQKVTKLCSKKKRAKLKKK
jgi:hypothetical protein